MPRKKDQKEDHEILIAFGKNLEKRRTAMGLSIRQFAAHADMDHAMIYKFEQGTGNPTLTTLAKLAAAFEVEPFELLKP